MNEPKAALDAIVAPKPLTLGKFAILARRKSPVLDGNVEDLTQNLVAIFVYSHDVTEVFASLDNLEKCALVFAESLSPDDYRKRLAELLDAIFAFYEMLPRPEDGSKKNSAMDSSPNS